MTIQNWRQNQKPGQNVFWRHRGIPVGAKMFSLTVTEIHQVFPSSLVWDYGSAYTNPNTAVKVLCSSDFAVVT
jgi:hypothetical protein